MWSRQRLTVVSFVWRGRSWMAAESIIIRLTMFFPFSRLCRFPNPRNARCRDGGWQFPSGNPLNNPVRPRIKPVAMRPEEPADNQERNTQELPQVHGKPMEGGLLLLDKFHEKAGAEDEQQEQPGGAPPAEFLSPPGNVAVENEKRDEIAGCFRTPWPDAGGRYPPARTLPPREEWSVCRGSRSSSGCRAG